MERPEVRVLYKYVTADRARQILRDRRIYWNHASLFLRLRNRDLSSVPWVQDHCQNARVALLGRVLRHAVQAAGRFVECLTGLQNLRRLVVESEFVLAFQDVPENRAGMAVRRSRLSWSQRHFHDCC